MSLFRNLRKPYGKVEPWQSYEMESFKSNNVSEPEQKNEFLIIDSLDLAVEKSFVTINVNPEDYEYVEKLKPGFFKSIQGAKIDYCNSRSIHYHHHALHLFSLLNPHSLY